MSLLRHNARARQLTAQVFEAAVSVCLLASWLSLHSVSELGEKAPGPLAATPCPGPRHPLVSSVSGDFPVLELSYDGVLHRVAF